MNSSRPVHVVVAGGGVAAIETVLALRDLAADRVRLTMVAPEGDFTLRPLRTAEPFAVDHVRVHSLTGLAARAGARLVADTVVRVDAPARTVRLGDGTDLAYDVLVLAVGARHRAVFRKTVTFAGDTWSDDLNGMLADVESGWTRSVAFVVPPGTSWPLPLYELALMTAAEVHAMGMDDVRLEIITPETAPLALFGPRAAAAMGALLDEAGIGFRGERFAESLHDGSIALMPGGERLDQERVVALPVIEGPHLRGVPLDEHGFIRIDDHCRVDDRDGVFAAGDGTTFPIKQGGIACQMADAIAQQIAAQAGAPVVPAPFTPVLRGLLLTPAGARALEHPRGGATPGTEALPLRLWSAPDKINGRYLSRWLRDLEDGDPEPEEATPPDGLEVEVPLNAWQRGQLAMRLDPYSPVGSRQAI